MNFDIIDGQLDGIFFINKVYIKSFSKNLIRVNPGHKINSCFCDKYLNSPEIVRISFLIYNSSRREFNEFLDDTD